MATTVFTGTISSTKTLRADTSSPISIALTRSSGSAIPAGAVVTAATISASKLYQYSEWRKFRVRKTNASGTLMSGNLMPNGNAYDSNSNLIVTSNTWNLYTTTSLYTDLTQIVLISTETDDNAAIMGLVSGCTITITVTYNVLPTLDSTQPKDAKVVPGATHTLSVVMSAAGSPDSYTYQWYKDGVAISGATGKTLAVRMGTVAATYYCVVTHTLGTLQTRTVTLDILGAACVFTNGAFASAVPYVYHNNAWQPAVPYVHKGGAFQATTSPN